eukprot:scaffold5227_cov105-Isochrysis_galbana.AAC.5
MHSRPPRAWPPPAATLVRGWNTTQTIETPPPQLPPPLRPPRPRAPPPPPRPPSPGLPLVSQPLEPPATKRLRWPTPVDAGPPPARQRSEAASARPRHPARQRSQAQHSMRRGASGLPMTRPLPSHCVAPYPMGTRRLETSMHAGSGQGPRPAGPRPAGPRPVGPRPAGPRPVGTRPRRLVTRRRRWKTCPHSRRETRPQTPLHSIPHHRATACPQHAPGCSRAWRRSATHATPIPTARPARATRRSAPRRRGRRGSARRCVVRGAAPTVKRRTAVKRPRLELQPPVHPAPPAAPPSPWPAPPRRMSPGTRPGLCAGSRPGKGPPSHMASCARAKATPPPRAPPPAPARQVRTGPRRGRPPRPTPPSLRPCVPAQRRG